MTEEQLSVITSQHYVQPDPYRVDIIQARGDVFKFMTEISRRTGRWMPGMTGDFSLVASSRIRMIFEEWNETKTAMDGGDVEGELDGLVDLLYVIIGLGIEIELQIWPETYLTILSVNDVIAFSIFDCRTPSQAKILFSSGSIQAWHGVALNSGLPVGAAWDEVHAANMRKFNGGSYDASTGKWRKPADWVGPDIAGILKRYPMKRP